MTVRLLRALGLSLCLAACLPAYSHSAQVARTTFYAEAGVMADGEWTYPGSAACSYDLVLGTRVLFLDSGETVTCTDRGALGSGFPTWVDIFSPNGWVDVAPWGDYRTVEIETP